MNDSTCGIRRPPRAWPRPARTAAAIIATASVALLAAACGGHPSPTGAGGAPNAGGATNSPSAVGYSHCMRSHGVPDFPDPPSNGGIPKSSAQELGVSSSRLQAAQSTCQHLLPNAGSFQQRTQQCFAAGDCPQGLVQQILSAQRKFARCMRSHGVPNWPDPSLDSEGRPIFNLIPVGITHSQMHSPPMTTKITECARLAPAPVVMASN